MLPLNIFINVILGILFTSLVYEVARPASLQLSLGVVPALKLLGGLVDGSNKAFRRHSPISFGGSLLDSALDDLEQASTSNEPRFDVSPLPGTSFPDLTATSKCTFYLCSDNFLEAFIITIIGGFTLAAFCAFFEQLEVDASEEDPCEYDATVKPFRSILLEPDASMTNSAVVKDVSGQLQSLPTRTSESKSSRVKGGSNSIENSTSQSDVSVAYTSGQSMMTVCGESPLEKNVDLDEDSTLMVDSRAPEKFANGDQDAYIISSGSGSEDVFLQSCNT